MADEKISAMTSGTPQNGSLFETSQPDGFGGWLTRSITAQQVLQFMSVPSTMRYVVGYGIQLFENDPAFASHPWRTLFLNMGAISLDAGVPAIAPAVPTMISAVHGGSSNVLTFSWIDSTYAATGNLVVYKNGVSLATLASTATSYTDTAGTGVSYQVQWTNGTFSSPFSNTVVSA